MGLSSDLSELVNQHSPQERLAPDLPYLVLKLRIRNHELRPSNLETYSMLSTSRCEREYIQPPRE
jgi:hypothetical protein